MPKTIQTLTLTLTMTTDKSIADQAHTKQNNNTQATQAEVTTI